ncbi:MAG: uroporphyrinogen-III C-methyltransferase [Pseudolysinimonas sp.]
MELDLDLRGRRVLIVGRYYESRRAIARYLASEARVFLASPTSAPPDGRLQVIDPRTSSEWADAVSIVDLVVAVDLDQETDALLSAACLSCRAWVSREPALASTAVGAVTLVGGGPGDDGLFTLAGRDALRHADVVYYDRLAPHSRLEFWAAGAELIDVGKKPGHHAVPQAQIERMMIASALDGHNVVRLKGGDPFVFGRGGEEVIACREAGVPVVVIPGVTSAIAVPGAAGIPVTHRDVSHLVTIVSGHAPLEEGELAHLAGLGGTIVVLMGVTNLPHLAAGLARHGMAPGIPVAIIERGFSPSQRTTIADIETVVSVAGLVGAQSPAVLVIGEVVALSGHAAVDLAELARTSSAFTAR